MSGQAGEVRIEHSLCHEKSKEELFMLKGVILLSFFKAAWHYLFKSYCYFENISSTVSKTLSSKNPQ